MTSNHGPRNSEFFLNPIGGRPSCFIHKRPSTFHYQLLLILLSPSTFFLHNIYASTPPPGTSFAKLAFLYPPKDLIDKLLARQDSII
jgi:hypothetical protein